MRTWSRTKREVPCGRCARRCAVGTPVLLVRTVTMHRELIRCPDCAGSEPPPDLPPLVETTAPIEQRFARFTAKREWMPYRDSD